jgi:aminopeptidase S
VTSSRAARSRIAALVLLAVAAFAVPSAAQVASAGATPDTDAAARVLSTVTAIAAGDDSAARRDGIVAALRAIGVEPALEPFGSAPRHGVNIVVTVPGVDTRTILVGAHYDRVAVGRGAVDNGASCAALIELIRATRASPLSRATLTFVFFDREETGLEGSRAHFASLASRPAYAVNLDIFAYGDVLFTTFSRADGALLAALKTAAAPAGIAVQEVARDRYPGSDHLTMMQAGVETLGLAIVDRADVDAVLRLDVTALKPGTGPRILTLIHTPNDTLDAVRPEQMVRGIAVVERLLRALDRE